MCQRQSACGAIREELEARGISLSAIERPLVSLVEMFRNAHQPIAKHLFSDAGIWLQNLDSDIMHGEVARSSIGRKRLRFRAFRNEKAV